MVNIRQLPLMVLLSLSLSGYVSAEQAKSPETPTEAQAESTDVHDMKCHSKEEHAQHCPGKHGELGKPDHLLPNCAHSKSVHDYVIFFPVLGPFVDLAEIGGKYDLKWWEIPLSVVIPFFGPGIARTNGTRICVDHMHMPHHGYGHGEHTWKHDSSL